WHLTGSVKTMLVQETRQEMEFSPELTKVAFVVFAALAVGGLAIGLLFPYFSGQADVNRRARRVTSGEGGAKSKAGSKDKTTAARRRQIQDTLKQFEEAEKKRRKKLTLRQMIGQAGLEISLNAFIVASVIVGVFFFVGSFIVGVPIYISAIAAVVGALGLPRWLLGYLAKRRRETFLREFADAIDVMVRGIKAGLPVSDALKVIAKETPAPVGPEFMDVVEGQRVGITIDQGLERMYERMPLAEVNFLAIVMAIQAKTGGNLAEALGNLSRVLRDRKKMKQKIQSVSQEAKASAAIIGALPFLIAAAMMVLNPTYLLPLFETKIGNVMLLCSGLWMSCGVLVMRKMINFDF
ncbi:MAG: type II secretion system F family protein, partial [Pseudomonadota bacterium]